MHVVTPQSHEYGDVTVTYICRAKIPSYICTKHQYVQASDCRSTVVIDIPIEGTSTQLSQGVMQYNMNITSKMRRV